METSQPTNIDYITKKLTDTIKTLETERIKLIIASPDFFTVHPDGPKPWDMTCQTFEKLIRSSLQLELDQREEMEKKIVLFQKMLLPPDKV